MWYQVQRHNSASVSTLAPAKFTKAVRTGLFRGSWARWSGKRERKTDL